MESKANKILQNAERLGVSDIHIIPAVESYAVRFRYPDGFRQYATMSFEEGERFITYFKFLANMDVGERRRPQSGSCLFSLSSAHCQVELRISTMTNFRFQESMVIRLLQSSAAKEYSLHSFFPKDVAILKNLLQHKSGLLLFSGPVGSGKTSTIYYLLRQKYQQEPIQVITMEDPVEIREPLFLQTEVNEKAGLGYEVLIKQSLRHHPDVLVIGEIRDEETAKMVIRSALTGHLVLATVHAKDCRGVLARLMEMSVSHEQLLQSLIGVVSQRLLNCYCPLCGTDCSIYCTHHDLAGKKAILFEIMEGSELKQLLKDPASPLSAGFNRKLRKAYGCGYIEEKTFLQNRII